jgi:hypothetical protein
MTANNPTASHGRSTGALGFWRCCSVYERAISQHLRIGIAAIDLLRQEGTRLHSRKLRSFDEPPFR